MWHTPVDRAGGVKVNALLLRFSGHVEISSFVHARYKYTTRTHTHKKNASYYMTQTERKSTSAYFEQ